MGKCTAYMLMSQLAVFTIAGVQLVFQLTKAKGSSREWHANIAAEVAKYYIDLLKFTGWGKSAHMTITFG